MCIKHGLAVCSCFIVLKLTNLISDLQHSHFLFDNMLNFYHTHWSWNILLHFPRTLYSQFYLKDNVLFRLEFQNDVSEFISVSYFKISRAVMSCLMIIWIIILPAQHGFFFMINNQWVYTFKTLQITFYMNKKIMADIVMTSSKVL